MWFVHISSMPWVLFFDGDCAFCNQWVRRLFKWDRKGRIHYAPLQGKLAAEHDLGSHLEGDQASMVVMQEDGEAILIQSDAVLQVLRLLGGPWKLLLCYGWLPKSWRDGLYRMVAQRRQALGDKGQSVCEMPSAEMAARLRD